MAGHGVATKAAKIRKYVQDQLGIDAGKLNDEDAKKVATFILRAYALETPVIAKHSAESLGLDIFNNNCTPDTPGTFRNQAANLS